MIIWAYIVFFPSWLLLEQNKYPPIWQFLGNGIWVTALIYFLFSPPPNFKLASCHPLVAEPKLDSWPGSTNLFQVWQRFQNLEWNGVDCSIIKWNTLHQWPEPPLDKWQQNSPKTSCHSQLGMNWNMQLEDFTRSCRANQVESVPKFKSVTLKHSVMS